MARSVAIAVVVHTILCLIVLLNASRALQGLEVVAVIIIDHVVVPGLGGWIRACCAVDPIIVVHRVHVEDESHLLEVASAGDHATLFTGFAQGGQQHGRQNRDDGNDDQQFDEGKTLIASRMGSFSHERCKVWHGTLL